MLMSELQNRITACFPEDGSQTSLGIIRQQLGIDVPITQLLEALTDMHGTGRVSALELEDETLFVTGATGSQR